LVLKLRDSNASYRRENFLSIVILDEND